MNTPHGLTAETHRLTDLPGTDHPFECRRCGGSNHPSHGNGLMRLSITRWQECDHLDQPENRIIVLCNKCSKELIEQHPRLYIALQPNQPWPGAMEICLDCKLRSGTRCTAPEAKANGGAGVMITVAKPFNALVDSCKYRGPMQFWRSPATACKQRQQAEQKS